MELMRMETPIRGLDKLSETLNRFLANPWPTFDRAPLEEALTVADWSPAVDIQENDKEYLIKAEIPEVKKENVKLTVEEGALTIRGERFKEKEEKGKRFHRMERSYGTFLRSFTLPVDADEKKIEAKFEDGMLNVILPKSEINKPKAIEIKVK
ncbi:MAG TPA: Hsp20/alpha crystallin family protein [Thermoanaerobaculia bacterium]|nr:Hsp20/alpha crystallin family protein [Thermoanaerobaculia bacterium]